MSKIIEITGPAGVGKTTILNNLGQVWKETDNWILKQKLFPRQKIDPLNVSSLAQNLPYLIKFGKTNLDNTALLNAGKRFIMQNSAYLDVYWHSLDTCYCRDLNGFDSRFDSAAKFYGNLQKYQYVKDHSINKYVLFDEGLVHHLAGRVPVVQNKLQDDFSDIHDVVDVMPLPEVLILIDADADIIVERIAQRKKTIHVHKQKSTEEIVDFTLKVQRRMYFVKDLLQAKGVSILCLDSKEPVVYNTQKIARFINEMVENKVPAMAV